MQTATAQLPRNVFDAITNSVSHPWDSVHLIFKDASMHSIKKITEVAVFAIDVFVLLSFNVSTTFLLYGKFISDLSKFCHIDSCAWAIFSDESISHNKKKHVDASGQTSLSYLVLAVDMVVMSATTLFIFSQKYVVPQLCNNISAQVVAMVGYVSTTIGNQSVTSILTFFTNVGVGTINKACVGVFFAYEAYHAYLNLKECQKEVEAVKGTTQETVEEAKQAPKSTLHTIKLFENVGKCTTIVLIFAGATTPLIAGFSLFFAIVALISDVTDKKIRIAEKQS